jgi:hypothetical protein
MRDRSISVQHACSEALLSLAYLESAVEIMVDSDVSDDRPSSTAAAAASPHVANR